MKLGIVGLPNVGKSTLFNSLTKAGAESANYPFCTIDPNVGIVAVPDERLDKLAALYNSAKITPAVIEFVDIAGLVKGASKGEGLGNQFLANIREVDAIVHVVRCFEDSNIVHVDGSVNPVRDIETINLELIFSDMEVLERRLAKQKRASYNNKDIAKECDLIERLLKFLEAGNLAKNFECEDEDEESFMREYNLLTSKPVIFAANVSEDDLADDGANNEYVQSVREYSKKDNCEDVVATIEKIRECGVKAAITLNPETPVKAIEPYLSLVDMVLVMSVHPGFGGQKFIPESLEKVKQIKAKLIEKGLDNVDIEIDGGINIENLVSVLEAGANVIVAGSAVFKNDAGANVKRFKEIMSTY
jgi:GTP-binding protein YchF